MMLPILCRPSILSIAWNRESSLEKNSRGPNTKSVFSDRSETPTNGDKWTGSLPGANPLERPGPFFSIPFFPKRVYI
jgi:hypothetical protein